jgi:hypothetical protein
MTKGDFETAFVVEMAPKEVWNAITRCADADPAAEGAKYVLPGWPSFPPVDRPGARCSLIERQPERLLRVRKDDMPCAGTEIAIRLEQADTGTRVTVVQSGFGDFLDIAGRDTVFTHGMQIANDFRLYLERGLLVPGTRWASIGANFVMAGPGVAVRDVAPDSLAARAGLQPDDLLLTLEGIRIHDLQQLWSVVAMLDAEQKVQLTWARGREAMAGEGTL